MLTVAKGNYLMVMSCVLCVTRLLTSVLTGAPRHLVLSVDA